MPIFRLEITRAFQQAFCGLKSLAANSPADKLVVHAHLSQTGLDSDAPFLAAFGQTLLAAFGVTRFSLLTTRYSDNNSTMRR